jgi:endoribonuclease Nob1
MFKGQETRLGASMGGGPGGEKGAQVPRKLVCDTSVLLAGGDPRGSPEDEVFVTPSVINEVKRPEDRERLETLRDIGLKLQTPSEPSLAAIDKAAIATGDWQRLSTADKELLALAMDLKAELLTDDRSMQNLAATLGMPYKGYAQSEIKGIWHWESQLKCIGCGRTFATEPPRGECTVCGHEVRKKHWRVPKGEAAGPKRRKP